MFSSETLSTEFSLGLATIRHEVNPSQRRLDDISSSRLDLAALQRMDPKLSEVFGCIRSLEIFESLFQTRPKKVFRRSHMSTENLDLLQQWEILRRAERPCDVKLMCSFFNVRKQKVEKDRLIINARPVNCCQVRPPHMRLPAIHSVLKQVSDFRFGASVDAVSYFYQFPLLPQIGAYFALAQNGKRGAPEFFIPEVLPMGWKFAPWLSQETALAICTEVRRRTSQVDAMILPWVDNFIICANSLPHLMHVIATLQEVAIEIRLALHPPVITDGGATLKALGIVAHMTSHQFQLDQN